MPSKDYKAKPIGGEQFLSVTAYWESVNPKKPQPIALLFHGGGFVIGTRFMIPSQQITDLKALGFVVISADYSLCPQVSLYHGPEQDAKDVYKWTKETFPGLIAEEGVLVDPKRVVAVGYSAGATLALCLGAESDPPAAILDFYGPKFFRDSFWSSPLPAMEKVPEFEREFINKIFDEPIQTSTARSLEKTAAEAAKPRTPGPPKADLSSPRNAWLFHSLKHGEHLKAIVQDDNLDRVDPVLGFGDSFPPTFFLHGDRDDWVLPRFSEQAHQRLKELGVESELVLLPGLVHGFDATLSAEDAVYGRVKEAFKFLANHVS